MNGLGNFKLDDFESIKCPNCGKDLFEEAIRIKKVPGTIVGAAGQTVPAPMPVYVCKSCGIEMTDDMLKEQLEATNKMISDGEEGKIIQLIYYLENFLHINCKINNMQIHFSSVRFYDIYP